MTARRTLRTRSLRSSSASPLIEGSVSRHEATEIIAVKVAGGPPRTRLDVVVAGAPRGYLELDSVGSGQLGLGPVGEKLTLEIVLGGRVLLTGLTPSTGGRF